MTSVLIERGEDRQTQRHTEGRPPYAERGRDCSDASISQAKPKTAVNLQKVGRVKEGLFSRAFRGVKL